MALATGQFTIIDFNDALTLTGFIGSNHPKTQIENPDNGAFIPDWSTSNLVLTPSLYKLGTTSDVIATTEVVEVKWYQGTSTTAITHGGNYALSGAKRHILTIKNNILSSTPSIDFTVEIIYRDATTNLDLKYKTGITFNKVINGGGIADAIAKTPEGNVSKNSEVSTLKGVIELWRGSVVDNTNVEYQWFMQDSSIQTDQGGGTGWRKLSDTSNKYTGTKTNTITVYADAVHSFGAFKASIKDTDTGSSSYNKFFWDTVTFIDNSDPIQVSISSTGGDVFKNGVGQTTLTAKLFQAGEEIDTTGVKYNYRWFKFDKNGNKDVNFGGTGVGYKDGKSLDVGDRDVAIKATFSVEVF